MPKRRTLAVDQALIRARTHARKGELDLAARVYKTVLKDFPKNKPALEGLKAIEQAAPDGRRTNLNSSAIDEQINNLTALFRQGRLQEALEQGTVLEGSYPDAPFVHHFIGAVKARMGCWDEAIARYTRSLHIKPDNPEVHYNLGVAFAALNRHEEAVACATKALELKPDYPEAYANLGNALIALGRPEEAIARYKQALQLEPKWAEAHYNLAVAYTALGRHEDAIADLSKALQIKPNFTEAHRDLAGALNALGKHDEAIVSVTKALELKPDDPHAYLNLGNALIAIGKLEEAVESLTRALQIKPDFAETLNNIGSALNALGKREQAIASLDKALQIKPDFAEAHRNLSIIKKYRPGDAQLAQMLKLIGDRKLTDHDKMSLSFALGKAFEDIDDVERSFRYLAQGNRLRKKELGYDIASDRWLFKFIKSIFDANRLPALQDAQPAILIGRRPIFVVGMPRSGTTLVEQILASHSLVFAAGELGYMNKIMSALLTHMRQVHTSRLTKKMLSAIRIAYLEGLDRLGATSLWVTDKMPINFRWIGFILTAMPEAKIINIRRDPIATCWSVFKHYFATSGNGYAYDLVDIAEYYKLYVDLMAFWRQTFPNLIFDLDYETLTEDQEEETRKLLEYCGLPWEDQCLEFHKTQRAVSTASSVQVRQKMYTGSSEAWRKYEAYIQPMVKALKE